MLINPVLFFRYVDPELYTLCPERAHQVQMPGMVEPQYSHCLPMR